jgi:nucleoside-diphosphate-sugar epimerase
MISAFTNLNRFAVTGGSGFIGTNLIDALLSDGGTVLNLDIKPPQNPAHIRNYRSCDILDRQLLERILSEFKADALVHLAARTDLVEGAGLQAYAANIEGVENVLETLRAVPTIRRALFTSSKLVNKNGEMGKRAIDYTADTLYGQSKVLGEQMVRQNPPACEWTIVRPTSIWGPWFDVPYRQFFRSVANKTYFHIIGCDLPKRFGYVGNTVAQIISLLKCASEQMSGQTFYLADYQVTTIREWADEISTQLHGKRNLSAPDWMVKIAARAGDIAKLCGVAEPPLTSFRLRNMSTPTADVPIEKMMAIAATLPFSQADGVRMTFQWLMAEKNLQKQS